MKKKISSLFMAICMTTGSGFQSFALDEDFLIDNEMGVQDENINEDVEEREDVIVDAVEENGVEEVVAENNGEEIVDENDDVVLAADQTSETSFEFDSSTGTITRFVGNETDVVIPDKIGGVSVTAIGDNTFWNCDELTNIIIPQSITSIGNEAFSECDGLTNVNIPNSVISIGKGAFWSCDNLADLVVSSDNEYYSSENGVLFDKDGTKLIQYPAGKAEKEYVIPNSVVTIDDDAFYCCFNLTSVTVPNSVVSIGANAFYSCSGITSLQIPNSVTSIGDFAFVGCKNLTEITIANDNKNYISENGVLFNKEKTKLIQYPIGKTEETYIIPNSVTSVAGGAFAFCDNITSVTIPSSVVDIDAATFVGGPLDSCDNLTLQVYSGSYAESYAKENNIKYKIIGEVPVTPSSSFKFDSSTGTITKFIGTETDVVIPEKIDGVSVTAIGENAFSFKNNLKTVIISNGVRNIGKNAFIQCENLINIEIPSSVTSIEVGAFQNCSNLTSIEIPSSVTSIGINVFFGDSKLLEINTSEENKNYNSENGILFNKTKTELIKYPEGKSGNNYVIPSSVTTISNYAFSKCKELTNIIISDNVTNIGDKAFSYCENLTSLMLNNNVESIGERVFSGCCKLTKIDVSAQNKNYSSENGVLFNKQKTELIKYPEGKAESDYKLPNGLLTIGSYSFENCINLKNVTIPDGVTSIGVWAFGECTNLANVIIPRSVTSIEEGAFDICNDLTLKVYSDSYAESYAKNNKYDYEIIGDEDTTESTTDGAIESTTEDTTDETTEGTTQNQGGDSEDNTQEQLKAVKAVYGGISSSVVLKDDGSVWQWERGKTPLKVTDNVVRATAKCGKAAAIKKDGSVYQWDIGSKELKLISGDGFTDIINVALGDLNSEALALKKDGTVYRWNRYSTNPNPVKVDGLTDVMAINAGTEKTSMSVVKKDGTVWIIEDDNTVHKIDGLEDVKKVESYYSFYAIIALKNDGTVWKYNGEDNTTKIDELDGTEDIATGDSFIVAFKKDGSVWEYNSNNSKCVNIFGADTENFSVGAGCYDGFALKTDGRLYQWYHSDYKPNLISGFNAKNTNNSSGSSGSGVQTPPASISSISGVENVTEDSTEETTEEKEVSYEYELPDVEDEEKGEQVASDFVKDMNEETKNSIDGMEKAALFIDEVIERSATIMTDTDQIIINDESVEQIVKDVDKIKNRILNIFDGIGKVRDEKVGVRIKTSNNGEVSIKKEELKKDIDNIKVETPYLGVNFATKDISELSVKNIGENTVSINFVNIDDNSETKPVTDEATTEDNTKETNENTNSVSEKTNGGGSSKKSDTESSKSTENETNDKTNNTDNTAKSENNKVSIDLKQKDTVNKVKISFPNINGDGKYVAIANEKGEIVGGKYNPLTGELSAKIEESGIYKVVESEKDFDDIKGKSEEMQDAIKVLASKGFISGTSEKEFSPDSSITRAEVAAIALRIISKLDNNVDGGFDDVTQENWYFGTAGSAKQIGMINGYEDNTFRGDVIIPKSQIITIAARVLKNEMNYRIPDDVEAVLDEYEQNSDIPEWAREDVALATNVNLVVKATNYLFGANEEMTRGDAAIVLKRLFDKIW